MPTRVRISARLIDWPPFCACCLAACDTTVNVAATRVDPRSEYRTQARSVEVPFCQSCLNHAHAAQHLDAARGKDGGVALAALGVIVAGGGVVAFFYGVAWFAWPLGLGVLAAVAGVFGAVKHYANVKDLEAQGERAMSGDCPCMRPAAAYETWHDTQHSFLFANDRYATMFARSNSGKRIAQEAIGFHEMNVQPATAKEKPPPRPAAPPKEPKPKAADRSWLDDDDKPRRRRKKQDSSGCGAGDD